MNPRLLSGMAAIALSLPGCKSPEKVAPTQPPSFRISSCKIYKLPASGGNIHVQGTGATANSDVVIILNYTTGSLDTEQLLRTVKSDGSGTFSLIIFQTCLLHPPNSPSRCSIQARDGATGNYVDTPALDPAFLVCPN